MLRGLLSLASLQWQWQHSSTRPRSLALAAHNVPLAQSIVMLISRNFSQPDILGQGKTPGLWTQARWAEFGIPAKIWKHTLDISFYPRS